MALSVLIVDDEESIRYGLREWLQEEGYSVLEAGDGQTALDLAKEEPEIVLLDYKLPDTDGLKVLRELTSRPGNPVIIMMTGYGTIELAVEAMRLGAYHFLTKPWDQADLASRLQAASELINLRISSEEHRATDESRYGIDTIIGESPAIRRAKAQALKVAVTDATVLLTGETGTGKEVFARAIHLASPRAGHEFIPVNCANIPENLLESELFGYEPGAFTDAKKRKRGRVERAHKGTLFLDEIGDMPLHLQAKILRVLENRTFERLGGEATIDVDVRVLAATHQNLRALIDEGRFREDLYYRLNVMPLRLPALRERKQDILTLAEYFIAGRVKKISAKASQMLLSYNWPGNVRELKNYVERAIVLGDGRVIQPEDLPISVRSGGRVVPLPLDSLERIEEDQIVRVLRHTGWNKSEAVKILGITRQTLDNKIERYKIKMEK